MNKFLVICVFICLVSFSVVAQSNVNSGVTPEMRTEANNFYQKQDWENAAKIYEKIVKLEENNVGAIYRLGLSLLNLNKNTEAKIYLEKVFNMSPNPVFALSLAKNYARLSDKEKVFEVLEKSITLGGINPDNLTADKDFEALKNEQKFADLVKKSDLAVNPCKASAEFRQFDFWIGEWDAKNTQGVTVGSSSIQLILGNCVIFENWSTPVSSGKSFNIYDKATKKWHQNWVDDKGNYTHYVGEIIDGKMVYIADSIQNGKKSLLKMTFSKLPNGNVHQHGESSTDEGKTWTTTFDFTYIRKK
jgi:tetratricopeptide (TPR) repeat protein